MKATEEQQDYVARIIGSVPVEVATLSLKAYKEEGLSNKRWRWDMWHLAQHTALGNSYQGSCHLYDGGLNDNHIDTILKKALK